MPITPFHFGLGGAVHAVAPKHVSFLAFCGANVLIDFEPLYYMVSGQYPLHRFFHTYIGVAIIMAATILIFTISIKISKRLKLPDLWGWQQLKMFPIAVGACAGSYSHIVLDSIMHSDIMPLAPFSAANPLFHIISVGNLHIFCIFSGAVALLILGIRHILKSTA